MQVAELQAWLQQRLPSSFQAKPAEVRSYNDEVVIVLQAEPAEVSSHEAELAWIAQQREATRSLRMQLANELQSLLRRPVAWGMRVGSSEVLFTTRSVPVMTRLGRAERDVLDTLVAAGVAETRSSALAYTVRAFATQHADWLAEVRQAILQVQEVRSRLKVTRQPGAPVVSTIVAQVDDENDENADEPDSSEV